MNYNAKKRQEDARLQSTAWDAPNAWCSQCMPYGCPMPPVGSVTLSTAQPHRCPHSGHRAGLQIPHRMFMAKLGAAPPNTALLGLDALPI